jgi:hypothetical protein
MVSKYRANQPSLREFGFSPVVFHLPNSAPSKLAFLSQEFSALRISDLGAAIS